MRKSQEEINDSFNPINLDYIFQEEDPLSPWLEEREGPLLDGIQNSEWLPINSDDDEGIDGGDDDDNDEGINSGLSPPSNNTGSGNGGNAEQSQGGEEGSYNSFQEEQHFRRDQDLVIDIT